MFAAGLHKTGTGEAKGQRSNERQRPAAPSAQQRSHYNADPRRSPVRSLSPESRRAEEEDEEREARRERRRKNSASASDAGSDWSFGLGDDGDADMKSTSHRKKRSAPSPEPHSDYPEDGKDRDEDGAPHSKKRKPGRPHTGADSKSGFGGARVDDAGPEYDWRAAGDGGVGGSGDDAGGGAALLSNKVYLPMDDLEKRLNEFEKLDEEKRWCPMCAVTALNKASGSGSDRNAVSKSKECAAILEDINKVPENNILGDWRMWAWAVKMKWDYLIRDDIVEDQQFGIRCNAPEWTIDCILYHYMREVVTERLIEGSQIRDIRTTMNCMKSEFRVQNPDGSVTLNHKLLPGYLSYSKELRSRMKEFKSAR